MKDERPPLLDGPPPLAAAPYRPHNDECDKNLYEGGTCTCDLVAKRDDYDDEPSNMAAMENGETFGDLW